MKTGFGHPGPNFDVKYELVLKQDISPRQWGLVFTFPRQFNTLRWWHQASGTWYPADHIGRPEGSATASPVVRRFVEEPRTEPQNPWSLDANALGTADFRSTKANICLASLSDGIKASFIVHSDDSSQSVRAWVDGDCVRLLVAGFNTGGSDPFFDTHYARERRPLKKGDKVEGRFQIRISFLPW